MANSEVTAANWGKKLKSITTRGANLESDIQSCTMFAMDKFIICTTNGAHCALLSELRQVVHGVKGLNGRKFDKYVQEHCNVSTGKNVNNELIFKLPRDTAPEVKAPAYPWFEQDMKSNREPKQLDTNDLLETLKKGAKSKNATLGYKVACALLIKIMGRNTFLRDHAKELESLKAQFEEDQVEQDKAA